MGCSYLNFSYEHKTREHSRISVNNVSITNYYIIYRYSWYPGPLILFDLIYWIYHSPVFMTHQNKEKNTRNLRMSSPIWVRDTRKNSFTFTQYINSGLVVFTHGNLYILATCLDIRSLQGLNSLMASERSCAWEEECCWTGGVRHWGDPQDDHIHGGPAWGRASGATRHSLPFVGRV